MKLAVEYSSVSISSDDCLGCGNCVAACPISNPESERFEEGEEKLKLKSGIAKKDRDIVCWEDSKVPDDCEKCTLICPTGAIKTV